MRRLLERGFSAVLLSGELSQHERNHSMQALRDARARVCVATDVAARGIDLPNLSLVIHADLPHDTEALQHRSGRTGRAGRKGVSALLVPASRHRRAERLLVGRGRSAHWSGPPTAEEIRDLDQNRMLQDPLLTETPAEEDFRMARLLLAERTPEQLGAALVRIYRSRLPAIEEVVDPGEESERREKRNPRSPTTKTRDEPSKRPHAASLSGGVAWFRLDIGRKRNADPKWLLPMLCRKGNVTRQDIGAIRIFDHETKIEVSERVSAGFAANMRRPGGDTIRVERLSRPAGAWTHAIAGRPKAKKNPEAETKEDVEGLSAKTTIRPGGSLRDRRVSRSRRDAARRLVRHWRAV